MSKDTSTIKITISKTFLFSLQIVFIILKLAGVITSWWVALLPILVWMCSILAVVLFVAFVAFVMLVFAGVVFLTSRR